MDIQGKRIHFIGIGGIGTSAMARMCMSLGALVSGSDQSDSDIIHALRAEGADVSIGADAERITDDIDMVIYTIAIPKDNPELVAAQAQNIPLKTYPHMLGEMTSGHKTIAVSGTHGKTTTTAMTATVFSAGSLDPYVIVGSLMKDIDTAGVETYSNYRKGTSEYFVIEACEYKRSFLNVQPEILVITNIEADHLDYYKDLADIQNAFTELAHKVPATGAIICNPNHPHLVPVLEGVTAQIIDYTQVDDTVFDLKVPGKHNRENAQCAYAVAEFCGMKKEDILKGLALFAGTWRRFEYKKILANGALLYDDYAHHPTEIRATLQAMREKFPDKEIMVAFHPHLYSRTKQLLADFVDALALADDIVLAPIFAARETFDPSVSSMLLAETLSEKGASAVALENFEQIAGYIADYGNSDTVVVTMGAGDIYKVGDMLA